MDGEAVLRKQLLNAKPFKNFNVDNLKDVVAKDPI
jgi:hypothetical protein